MINFKPFQNLYQQVKAKDMRLFEALDSISTYLQKIGTFADSLLDARGNLKFLQSSNLQIPNRLIKVTSPNIIGLSVLLDDGITVTIPILLSVLANINTTGVYKVAGTQVVGAQLAAITVPSMNTSNTISTAGVLYTATEQGMINTYKTAIGQLNTDVGLLVTAVNDIVTRLHAHGLVA